jgi:hypothetical protein
MALSTVAVAQGFDSSRLFFGGGFSSNDTSGSDDAVGYQIFGGYGFGEVAPKFFIDAEVGYMDSGDMATSKGDVSAKGLWAAAVGRYLVVPSVELIARLGLDFGDDDGLLAGIGAGVILSRNFKLRLEYVKRDNVDSVQFNLVFQP